PVARRLADQLVDLIAAGEHAVEQPQGEALGGDVVESFVDERLGRLPADAGVQLVLEQQLKRHLTGAGSFADHGFAIEPGLSFQPSRSGEAGQYTDPMTPSHQTLSAALDFAAARARRILDTYPGYVPMYTVGGKRSHAGRRGSRPA